MENKNPFLSQKQLLETTVGFSKKDFYRHHGISGLKFYLIAMYLRVNITTGGKVSLTLNDLLEGIGYLTKTHSPKIYDDLRKIINDEIILPGYATCSKDILTVTPFTHFYLQFADNKYFFYTEDSFVPLTVKEWKTIVSAKTGTVNKSILIGTYLYIKQFIPLNSYSDDEIARIAYPSKKSIQTGIGIASIRTIYSAINILKELELLYVSTGYYVEEQKRPGIFVPTSNVYALDPNQLSGERTRVILERMYQRPVYKKEDVPGKILFIRNRQQDS